MFVGQCPLSDGSQYDFSVDIVLSVCMKRTGCHGCALFDGDFHLSLRIDVFDSRKRDESLDAIKSNTCGCIADRNENKVFFFLHSVHFSLYSRCRLDLQRIRNIGSLLCGQNGTRQTSTPKCGRQRFRREKTHRQAESVSI